MTDISEYILFNYKVRKNKRQKQSFREYIKKELTAKSYEVHIESGGLIKSNNIVVGEVDTADLILTAHYDTCATMPVPNFITPKNIIFFIVYQLAIVAVLFAIAGLTSQITFWISHNYFVKILVFVAILNGFCFQIMAGKANKNNFNDNTSGVITLIEIASSLPDDLKNRVALVFFDNEELGLLGSGLFNKKHGKSMKDKLLINFDCVSDGDNILIVSSKPVIKDKSLYEKIKSSFETYEGKKIIFTSNRTTFYPSDQMVFRKTIAVAALNRAPFIGLYMDRIHTNRDVIFDKNNIMLLSQSMIHLIQNIR